jgi:hypothetical protein
MRPELTQLKWSDAGRGERPVFNAACEASLAAIGSESGPDARLFFIRPITTWLDASAFGDSLPPPKAVADAAYALGKQIKLACRVPASTSSLGADKDEGVECDAQSNFLSADDWLGLLRELRLQNLRDLAA